MKSGFIDIDGKIPNLALMKLSAHHKQKGHACGLTAPLYADQYDAIFASKIFDFSPMPILPNNSFIGGSGYSLKIELDQNIEHLYPDYELYDCDYAIGFTSRGCYRKCPFCIVPQKEGRWRAVADIYEFWNGQDRIMLLDNSLNTDQGHFLRICGQLSGLRIAVDFSQGLDIRYLTDAQAWALTKIKLWKQIHFAWDLMAIEKQVRKGIEILGKYNLKYKSMFYVLIGFNTNPAEDLYRVETLRELGVDPFVMPFDKHNEYQRNFARWVNHKAIFKSVTWQEYRP